jgi:carbon-monoxide dehydrogenase medium subunit
MISEFEYLAPKTLQEALEALDEHADDCKIICGGQSLLVLMRQGLIAPAFVIDIKGVSELDYIKYDASDGMKIGAITTHRTIEKSAEIQKYYPVLSTMERKLASIQTRNRGSIGGNICHGDPAGDPAPVLMSLGASLKLSSVNGDRIVNIDEFYTDYFETILEHNEILTEIQIPAPAPYTGYAYSKFNIIQSDMATVGAGVAITLDGPDGVCKDVKIALGAMAPTAKRATKAEAVLLGKKPTEALFAEAGEVAATETEPISDIAASAEYRTEVCKVWVKRMAAEAYGKASKA